MFCVFYNVTSTRKYRGHITSVKSTRPSHVTESRRQSVKLQCIWMFICVCVCVLKQTYFHNIQSRLRISAKCNRTAFIGSITVVILYPTDTTSNSSCCVIMRALMRGPDKIFRKDALFFTPFDTYPKCVNNHT